MAAPRRYPQELRDRAIRLAKESDRPLAHIARDLGVHPEALRNWVRQDEADRGVRADQLSTAERDELKRLRADRFGVQPICRVLGYRSASTVYARRNRRPRRGGS
jgi:transposase